MNKALVVLAVAVAMLMPLTASAHGRGHGVVVFPFVAGSYVPFGGPYWGPAWGPYWDVYFAPDPYDGMGVVKIDTKVKDAQIYVDGGYLGTTGHDKTFRLRPGGYTIEVREAGRKPFKTNVYVAADRTVHLKPGF
jgi:hypothetical protein